MLDTVDLSSNTSKSNSTSNSFSKHILNSSMSMLLNDNSPSGLSGVMALFSYANSFLAHSSTVVSGSDILRDLEPLYKVENPVVLTVGDRANAQSFFNYSHMTRQNIPNSATVI